LDYARDLKSRINDTMARYGQQSQTLDQSFPQRLLSSRAAILPAGALKQRMEKLDERRNELKAIGLLDKLESHPFNTAALETLEPAQQSVMALYVEDTERKLSELDDLARRARLLLDNVNRKFHHKTVRIDRELGLVAEGEQGRALELDALSSGEQHELVLHYDLLFRVRPNTLVLIDEPELSLHVAWQKRFLPDLLEIVETAQCDVLMATHSPFIVGDRSDLMVGLDADLV
jgi:predicted ATPase